MSRSTTGRRRWLVPALLGGAVVALVALVGPLLVGRLFRQPGFVYDPYLNPRHAAGGSYQGLGINPFGFVHNGDAAATPDFAPGTRRVFILGGSSAAGIGREGTNRTTIAANLERLLNQQSPGARVQVINAGAGGYYTPLELAYLTLELVHYAPSLVMSLDGWNDFWHSYVPAKDSADDLELRWALPHRSSYQQRFLSVVTRWNGQSVDANPWRHNARYLRQHRYRSSSHIPYFRENWTSMVGVCRAHGVAVALYLQPVLPASAKRATPDELGSYRDFLRHKRLDVDEYEAALRLFFGEARAVARELGDRFRGDPRVHVEDLTSLFDTEPRTVFEDTVHYRALGNELLARRMAADATRLLAP